MRVLLTNPEVDALTCYLTAWTNRILNECGNKTNKYCHLKRERVTRKKFESVLKKRSVDLVLLNGHGDADKVYGNEDVILDKNNDELLEGKVVHALSCQSAKDLGKDASKKGAKAYIVLLRGGTPGEAVSQAKKAYNKSIRNALNSNVQSDNDQFVNWLFWDRDNLVCCCGESSESEARREIF